MVSLFISFQVKHENASIESVTIAPLQLRAVAAAHEAARKVAPEGKIIGNRH